MIRRTFFQLLTGLAIPQPPWNTQRSPSAAGPAQKPALPTLANDAPDPEWLKEWLRLPRLPVLSDDLPQILDPHERDLAALILQRIRSGRPIDFHYFGGSQPGPPPGPSRAGLHHLPLMSRHPVRAIKTRSIFSPGAKPAMLSEHSASTAFRSITWNPILWSAQRPPTFHEIDSISTAKD